MQTTVQDYPGRTGFWHVGVPPSGPMDALAFRLANRLVGNPEPPPALECTMTGPTLRFHQRRRDRARRRRHGARRSTASRVELLASLSRCGPARSCAWARARGLARAPTSRCAAASTCPNISAAAPRSSSASSAATPAALLRAGDMLRWSTPTAGASPVARRRSAATLLPAVLQRVGDRRALRSARRAGLLHRRRHRDALRGVVEGPLQLRSHRRPADRAASRSGREKTAAKPGCTRRTCTTTPMPSARWTSPATCRSCSAPTARASAASSVPAVDRARRAVEDGPAAAGDTVRFCRHHRTRRRREMERELDRADRTARESAAAARRAPRARTRDLPRSAATRSIAPPAIAIC